MVIAVLAAISVVAYNGIQDRTHDSAVRSDFRNFAQKMKLLKVDRGTYPAVSNVNDAEFSIDDGISITQDAYETENITNNVRYCASPDGDMFVLRAQSKSGTIFQITDSSDIEIYTSTPINNGWSVCSAVGWSADGNPNQNPFSMWRAEREPQWSELIGI